MILMLIFLVLLLQRGVQASQPIPINVINLERDNARLAAQVKQLQSKGVQMKRVTRSHLFEHVTNSLNCSNPIVLCWSMSVLHLGDSDEKSKTVIRAKHIMS